jgi:hypothetical protein
MAKFNSPVLGYNNNVRHRNRVFHIQTEDSGVNHPHIITHLFMDGGRILKSMKRSYAEHVGSDGLTETVRQLMKEQHKAMFIALRDGQFDALVEGHVTHVGQPAEAKKAAEPKPPAEAKPAAPPPAEAKPAAPPPVEAKPASKPADEPKAAEAPISEAAPPTDPSAAPSIMPRPPASDPSQRSAPPLPSGAPAPARKSGAPAPASARPAAVRAEDMTMDFDALGRAGAGQPFFNADGLPPPPKTALAAKPRGGGYSNVDERGSAGPASSRPRIAAEELRATPSTRGGHVRPEASRYAPARPAAIFGQPRASKFPPSTASLFGDDLVGDKSLDEVILSYLAEDLERHK